MTRTRQDGQNEMVKLAAGGKFQQSENLAQTQRGGNSPGPWPETSAPRLIEKGPPGAGLCKPAPVISPAVERKVRWFKSG